MAPTARAVLLHLERLLRGAARAGGRDRGAFARCRQRACLARGRARAPGTVLGRGGRRRGGRRSRPRRLAVHAGGRLDAGAAGGGHPRRRPLQRAGANAALTASRRGRGRHGGQVPGAAGAGRHRLDGELDRRGCAPRNRLRLRLATASTSPLREPSAEPSSPARPLLLDADCKTVEQMRLVSAVCWFVELAGSPVRVKGDPRNVDTSHDARHMLSDPRTATIRTSNERRR